MTEQTVALEIADQGAAIRYLGEMQSRAMDPVHEPIQNLVDEGAKRIEVELDGRARTIRIRGDARPITSPKEAERILKSICSSVKRGAGGKLGEKGVGMLSFVSLGRSMTTLSQSGGRVVWFTLDREQLARGRVGSARGNRLPFAGTEVLIKGVSPANLRHRLSEDRVIKDVKRRWGTFLSKGLSIRVNGKDVATFHPPPAGEPFTRRLRLRSISQRAHIQVDLLLLAEPSEMATVGVTHGGQANFGVADVPIFDGHNAFTQGMVHGTVTGDAVPINASRTMFQEGPAFDAWVEAMLELDEELGRLIEERIQTAAEQRDAEALAQWMAHLKSVFRHTELESTTTSSGEGEEEGWAEAAGGGRRSGAAETPRPAVASKPRKGGAGRLPTVPYAGFTRAPPNIRVVRERKAFRINVNHPDCVLAAKQRGGRRKYIREVCTHEAYLYSLEGKQRDWYADRSDEYLTFWTRAFIGVGRR